MPRYKHPQKIPEEQEHVIFGMGDNPDALVVQKTTPMLMLHNSQLDLFDLKLLDVYLGRINSHNPTNREICFKKGELEDLFGVSRIRSEVLSAHLDRLMQPVTLDISDEDGQGWLKFHLFSRAKAYKSDEDGLWTISMKCSEEALQFVFFPEQIGYLRYFLREISKLQSKHSYRLFILLESRRSSGLVQTYDLDELKQILGCDDNASYDDFKIFNRAVLRKAQQELAEKTQCRFSYETLNHDKAGKTFRRVAAIRFTLEPLPSSVMPAAPVDSSANAVEPAAVIPALNTTNQEICACDTAGIPGLTSGQLDVLRKCAEPLAAADDRNRSADDVIEEYVKKALAYSPLNLFAYVKKSILNDANAVLQKAQEAAARRQEEEQRAREDMERTMRILKQFDDEEF